MTSRPTREIRHGLQPLEVPGSSFIHLRDDNEEEVGKISREIDIFIEARVRDIGNKLELTEIERNLLQEKLVSAQNRTYLWVSLTLNLVESDINLSLTTNGRTIAKITSGLPETVDEAYERILATSRDHETARLLLHIVVGAARPLTLEEMNLALQLGPENNHKSYRSIFIKPTERIRNDIRDLCGLFVIVVESKIYLIHQTAKEFLILQDNGSPEHNTRQAFKWKNSLRPKDSHQLLFDISFRHLFFEEFESDPLLERQDASEYVDRHILLDYSAKYWTTHLRKSEIDLDQATTNAILKLCDTTSKSCLTWFRVFWASTNTDFPGNFTTLMLASYFGFTTAVKSLLESDNNIDANAKDDKYRRSALSWAAGNGFDAIVTQLVKRFRWKGVRVPFKRRSNVNSRDIYKRTPLVYAVWNRHILVVKILLKAGARVDLADDIGGTPLSYAICSGHEDVAEELLKKSSEAGSKDSIGVELLHSAAAKGDEDAVKLLLEIGKVHPDELNKFRDTPILRATENGREGVVRLLVQNGADIETRGENDRTALLYAATKGHSKIVRLLLQSGADIEARYEYGEASLKFAVELNRLLRTREIGRAHV